MFAESIIEPLERYKKVLEEHPVYGAVESLEDLRCFMEHHVFSVWDFMSLVKDLQSVVAPARAPWTPRADASVRRFINELVLEEESDETRIEGEFASHFELYQHAMREVGADVGPSLRFVRTVEEEGIDAALKLPDVPIASKRFTAKTFAFVQEGKPHRVAAALAFGREQIIPTMFRSILERSGVTEAQAPTFHFYLERHIHLDGDHHGPMSVRLVEALCGGEEGKIQEAMEAARSAISARIEFWDGVLEALGGRAGGRRTT